MFVRVCAELASKADKAAKKKRELAEANPATVVGGVDGVAPKPVPKNIVIPLVENPWTVDEKELADALAKRQAVVLPRPPSPPPPPGKRVRAEDGGGDGAAATATAAAGAGGDAAAAPAPAPPQKFGPTVTGIWYPKGKRTKAQEEARRASSRSSVPMLLKNRLPGWDKMGNDTERFKTDMKLRPKELSVDDEEYEQVPLEKFGLGMLQGMGVSLEELERSFKENQVRRVSPQRWLLVVGCLLTCVSN